MRKIERVRMKSKIHPMKSVFYSIVLFLSISLLTGCATIIGGSRYYAHVKVPDHPTAKISYKGEYQGAGDATFMVKRSEANKLSITVQEAGSEEQTFNFTQRKFRGWSFVGTIVTWTGIYSGFPLPWGVVVDLSTGALWKPSLDEKGISKMNYRNYNYILDYKGSTK